MISSATVFSRRSPSPSPPAASRVSLRWLRWRSGSEASSSSLGSGGLSAISDASLPSSPKRSSPPPSDTSTWSSMSDMTASMAMRRATGDGRRALRLETRGLAGSWGLGDRCDEGVREVGMPGFDRPSVGVAAVGKGVAVADTLWIKGHKNNSKVAMLSMDELTDFRLDRYVEQGSCCQGLVCKLVFPQAGTYLQGGRQ